MEFSYYKELYDSLSRKYSNRKVYVISDHHFYHAKIIKYERGYFDDLIDMHDYIINKHNSAVKEDDIVLFLGDFTFKKTNMGNLLSRMNGHKYLILGNHDNESWIKSYNLFGFEGVFSCPVKFCDSYLSHYPLDDLDGKGLHYDLLYKEFNKNSNSINYHGHIHGGSNTMFNYKNVSCESLDYIPMYIGNTGTVEKKNDNLLNNNDLLICVLDLLVKEKNFSVNLILIDYIYSLMLECMDKYNDNLCIYGSYPLYKKYGYISNFADLDVAVIYNESISNALNTKFLKNMVNDVYKSLNDIDSINLEFIKRYANMCAFSYLFSNKGGNVVKGALDVNMIGYNFFRDSDFIRVDDMSAIEKYIPNNYNDMLEGINMPRFSSNYLTVDGDISNLVLQILFQKDNEKKKDISLKKLRYISNFFESAISIEGNNLDDTITRFFLRNVMFLYTLRRMGDIDFIKDNNNYLDLIDSMPMTIKDKLKEILVDDSSLFSYAYLMIGKTDNKDIGNVCKKLVKEIK